MVHPSKSGPEAADTKSGQHPYSVCEQPDSSSSSPDAAWSSSSCPGQPRLCRPVKRTQTVTNRQIIIYANSSREFCHLLFTVHYVLLLTFRSIDSAPSLGVYYFLSLALSVCMSVWHKHCFFFVSRWNRAISWPSVFHDNKKLSYCWETVRRESMPRIAEMDVEMTT